MWDGPFTYDVKLARLFTPTLTSQLASIKTVLVKGDGGILCDHEIISDAVETFCCDILNLDNPYG